MPRSTSGFRDVGDSDCEATLSLGLSLRGEIFAAELVAARGEAGATAGQLRPGEAARGEEGTAR